jgi:hypothetical protein
MLETMGKMRVFIGLMVAAVAAIGFGKRRRIALGETSCSTFGNRARDSYIRPTVPPLDNARRRIRQASYIKLRGARAP